MATQLNGTGVSNANARIAAGDVDKSSSWGFSAEDGNKLLGPNGDDWTNYAKWHLAVDTAAPEKTKGRYKYPFGKAGKVYRSGVIAAEARAAQQGDTGIAAAAKTLLSKIDGKSAPTKEVGEMKRAWARMEIKGVTENPDGEMMLEGLATTPSTDRYGDVVEPMGAQFNLPMPLLYQHNSRMPIGTVTYAKPNEDGIPFKATIARKGVTDFIDEARALIKEKLLRGVSIGFIDRASEPLDPSKPYSGGQRFTEWEWLELSAVTIPANVDASIQTIKSYDEQQGLAAALGKKAGRVAVVRLGNSLSAGDSAPVKLKPKGNGMAGKTIAEQISAYEAKRQASVAELKAIMDKSGENLTSLDERESEKYEELKAEVEACRVQIARLKEHQKMLLENGDTETVDPARNGGGGGTPDTNDGGRKPRTPVISGMRSRVEQGIPFVRYAIALARAKGNVMLAAQIADGLYRDTTPEVGKAFRDQYDFEMQQRTTVAAGNTTDSTWAGPLVQLQPMASEFIEFLRPQTLLGRMSGFRTVPFNISVPRQTAGGSSKWVGQDSPKPLTKQAYDLVTLRFAKISTIVVLSEELVRFSNPSAELLARQDMANAISQYMDEQAFNPDVAAVSNVSPAAMTNGATKVNATGTSISSVDTDVGSIFAQFSTNNVSLLGAYWLMNPRTAQSIGMLRTANGPLAYPDINASGGTFWGFPVLTSNNLGISSVSQNETIAVFINPREILLADDGAMTLDMSAEASLEFSDAPTGGATSLKSLWQNNLIALKAERFINWLPRRSHAVVVWDGLRL